MGQIGGLWVPLKGAPLSQGTPPDTPLGWLPLQTYIGSVLVSVNPYKDLEIYSKQHMNRYRGVSFYEVSPHLWVPEQAPCSPPPACPHPAFLLHCTAKAS